MRRALLLLTACAAPDAPTERFARLHAPLGPTVESKVASSCSTTSVWGLSEQVVAMMNCLNPGSMAEVTPSANVEFGAAVFPFMQAAARDAFEDATAADGQSLYITSMFRTVVQQYLLYRWYQGGLCGIGLAAPPGSSNHESGLAFDTSDAYDWIDTMAAYDFDWLGSSDPVHFDYVGPGAKDLQGEDVRAFQALWNLHNPGDLIDEDGIYGPQTGARIKAAPADGFPGGVTCPGVVDPPVEDTWTPPPAEDTWSPPPEKDAGSPPPEKDTGGTPAVADSWEPPAEDTAVTPPPEDVLEPAGDTGGAPLPVEPTAAPDVASGPGDASSSPLEGAGRSDVAADPQSDAASPATGTVLPGGGCATGQRSDAPLWLLLGLAAWSRRRFR